MLSIFQEILGKKTVMELVYQKAWCLFYSDVNPCTTASLIACPPGSFKLFSLSHVPPPKLRKWQGSEKSKISMLDLKNCNPRCKSNMNFVHFLVQAICLFWDFVQYLMFDLPDVSE